jgi:LPPG:FO 2-phospho-L-lactate transferase
MTTLESPRRIVALCGGVGGAKLALGLYRTLPPQSLTLIVNTGDDFQHLGLKVCPDLDTVLYTLAGLEHPEQGWGRRDETWTLMKVLEFLGEETWFRLGDADTAWHIARTVKAAKGWPLSLIVQDCQTRLGIHASVLPMTDAAVATRVDTEEGDLGFQEYFVKRRCQPRVRSIRFEGAAAAAPVGAALDALHSPDLAGIVICPSNPYLSIDPILAIPALRAALAARRVPLMVVSPLIAGKAVKGPTAKIMMELGIDGTPAAIAAHYGGLMDALVVDSGDTAAAAGISKPVFSTDTLMRSAEDRRRLARFVLEGVDRLRSPV